MPEVRWTKEKKEKLQKLVLEGKTHKEIGEIFELDYRTIGLTIKRFNLKMKKEWTREELKRLQALYEDGCPRSYLHEIFSEFSVNSLYTQIDRLGLLPDDKISWNKNTYKYLAAIINKFDSLREICSHAQLSEEAIVYRIKEIKKKNYFREFRVPEEKIYKLIGEK